MLRLLEQRGIKGEKQVESFLFPKLSDLPAPDKMKNLGLAAEKVLDFIENDKAIIIWGDYDVDGTTGTSLLVNFFRMLGVSVCWHIPNRLIDGYGLNTGWFQKEHIPAESLVITVDCGISNYPEIDFLRDLGISVIVTDHHQIPESGLPRCLVVNPEQEGCGFKDEKIAGVGVAFYLAAAIRAKIREKGAGCDRLAHNAAAINLKTLLPFVAIGTIADIVRLTTTNRILIRAGLESIENSEFPGVRALLDDCEINDFKVSSEDIGFLLGPRLNAAGRLGDSTIVVELLTCDSEKMSQKLVKRLNRLNAERRELTADNFHEASCRYEEQGNGSETRQCVVFGDFHPGVAGIVASRLMEKKQHPVFILCRQENSSGKVTYKGSGRSVEGVNLVASLTKCSDFLNKFGGHEMAAGLEIAEENLEFFIQEFNSSIAEQLKMRKTAASSKIDLFCSVEEILNREFMVWLNLLEPFGPGNEIPVFCDRKSQVIHSKTVGRDSTHLNVLIRGKFQNYKGIAFGLGEKLSDIQSEPNRQIVFTPTKNRFRGTVSWQARIISI